MYKRSLLSAAILLLVAQPACAEIVLGKVGNTEVKFEGLVQADYDFFSSDRAQIDDQSEVRRAELILKGKTGPFDWVAGYDAKADKWLDLNARYAVNDKIGVRFGQFKQPIGLEELGSVRYNDFVSKAMITNSFAVSRRLGAQFETGGKQWTLSASVWRRTDPQSRAWFRLRPARHLHSGAAGCRHRASGRVLCELRHARRHQELQCASCGSVAGASDQHRRFAQGRPRIDGRA
jgi:hypothetical protein